ncbi:MAG: PepSY domain-containing protein [Cardiobacteriaceae bacterium]|nr:PepSY domain-containing protein [Cardiobacteriaceae bacterium]
MKKISLIITSLLFVTQAQAISLSEAVDKAQSEGNVTFVRLMKQDGKDAYRVMVISDDGERKMILLDAETGEKMPEPKPEPFSAPKFSIKDAIAQAEKEGKVVAISYMAQMGGMGRGGRGMGGDRQKDAPAKAVKPFYSVTVEKDGQEQNLIFSAEDGKKLDKPEEK